MRIGYGKLGRSWKLDPTKGTTTGGDADVARALHLLSRLRPDDEFVLVSNNSGDDPVAVGYPSNVVNPWTYLRGEIKMAKVGSDERAAADFLHEATRPLFKDLDAMIMWAGQHGTSNTPIPGIADRSVDTKPQISFINYASYILNGINDWRESDPLSREEMWLCPDPRNYIKCRDLKWPLKNSIIAQFNQFRNTKHERYGDESDPRFWDSVWDPKVGEGVWLSPSVYEYCALELTALPHPNKVLPQPIAPWDERHSFGMIVNENRAYVARDRLSALQDWVLPSWPDAEIFGTWLDASKKALSRPDIRPCPYEYLPMTLQRWRSTLTTPASGTGWATAKPWECFAHGVVCFFHPHYDTQDHVLKDASTEMRQWLRVKDSDELRTRVSYLDSDRSTWEWLIQTQRTYYDQKYREHRGGVRTVLERLDR